MVKLICMPHDSSTFFQMFSCYLFFMISEIVILEQIFKEDSLIPINLVAVLLFRKV